MLVKDYIKKHGSAHFQSVLTKEGKQKLSYPNWIITDMRFPNEMDVVKAKGGITIRVNRDNGTRAIDLNPHPSETSLDSHKFDYTIENDGSLEDLVHKVRFILQKENII